MADQSDVRRIALSLPETSEEEGRFAFSVRNGGKEKGFAWVWMERVEPKKPRRARPDVIALRVRSASEKEMLLASDREKFFTEAHYNGFPAVLARLGAIDLHELEELITDAWRCQAPGALVATLTLPWPAPAATPDGLWVEVASLDDLGEGAMVAVTVDAIQVLLVNIGGEVRAYDNRCPHAANPLSLGHLDQGRLTCAAHGWVFDGRDGQGINQSAAHLRPFGVRVEGGVIAVNLGR